MLSVFLVLVLIGLTLVSPQWFLVRAAMSLKGLGGGIGTGFGKGRFFLFERIREDSEKLWKLM
jgi:hypothetical protein